MKLLVFISERGRLLEAAIQKLREVGGPGARGGGTAFPVFLSDGVLKHRRKTMDTHGKIPRGILSAARGPAQKVTSRSSDFFFLKVWGLQEPS